MAELNKLTVEMWQYNHSGTAWRGDLTVMSNHKKLKQLSCKAPPGDHLCRITFIQAFSKADPTESDLRYSNVSGKMPFQNFSLPFHLSFHFAFAGRPPPLQLVPPSTLTWQPQTPLSRRQWREPIYRWIKPSNIFDLLVIYWPPTWITWITTFLQPISKFPQPDLLPDEQVICQADRVVTYSTG